MSTLAQLVTRWRARLGDSAEPYLWSDEELTSHFNAAVNLLCHEVPVIVDNSTASVCVIPVVSGTAEYDLSDRVVFIKRAKISTRTTPLDIVSVEDMDGAVSDWENVAADIPTTLIKEGVTTGHVRLHPKPSANATLTLTVSRLPLTDLVYATNSATVPEIPDKYLHLLDNGVCYFAYAKDDTDTANSLKADRMYKLFMMDIERLKRSVDKSKHVNRVIVPSKAFM
jgi:hypothetical protein